MHCTLYKFSDFKERFLHGFIISLILFYFGIIIKAYIINYLPYFVDFNWRITVFVSFTPVLIIYSKEIISDTFKS